MSVCCAFCTAAVSTPFVRDGGILTKKAPFCLLLHRSYSCKELVNRIRSLGMTAAALASSAALNLLPASDKVKSGLCACHACRHSTEARSRRGKTGHLLTQASAVPHAPPCIIAICSGQLCLADLFHEGAKHSLCHQLRHDLHCSLPSFVRLAECIWLACMNGCMH